MKRYFRAKKRSRQRDRSSSAYCQKEETNATQKDAEGATGRCNKESQQLIRKESQQHRASVNKVECKQIDFANNSKESQDSKEQARCHTEAKTDKHTSEAKSIESENVTNNLNFVQETKKSREYQENDKLESDEDKESKSSSGNNRDHEIIGSAHEKLEGSKSNSVDHQTHEDKKPKFTYEIIEEIVQRTEVTYYVTKRDHKGDNGAAGRLMNMTPKNITSQQKECSLGSSSCASDEGVDMREDELTVYSGNRHLEGNCLLVH